MKKVKVLVLDDSLMARETIAHELEQDGNIEVAKASTVFQARDCIEVFRPDILISDVVMDKMDGVEFVRQILPQYTIPVIMISAYPEMQKRVAQSGDFPFVLKPTGKKNSDMDVFLKTLLLQVKAIIGEYKKEIPVEMLARHIIAIGASTGGAEALECILKKLPAVLPPVVIAQHMPAKFTKSFAERLNSIAKLSVQEAQHGKALLPGVVYIAPGGYHISVVKREHKMNILCEENCMDNRLCPRIDTLFASVARTMGKNAVGVLLTGMGKDGAEGLLQMRRAGAQTIAQDQASCIIYGMPKAAYELGAVDYQLPLEKIANKLLEFNWKK